MNIHNNVSFGHLETQAREKLDSTSKHLEKVRVSFGSKLGEVSGSSVIASMIGTTVWTIAFGFLVYFVGSQMPLIFAMLLGIVLGGLMVLMYIDEFLNFKYYNSVYAFSTRTKVLLDRVRGGKEIIGEKKNQFMNAKSRGWNQKLVVGNSVSDETMLIEDSLSKIGAIKKGFVEQAKIGFYYVGAVATEFIGGYALFYSNSGNWGDISDQMAELICFLALTLIAVAQVFIAKYTWSRTDCEVTNLTLVCFVLGPIACAIILLIGAFLIALAWGLLMLVLRIAAVFVALGLITASIGAAGG